MIYQSQFIEMFGSDSLENCKWSTKSFGELFEISSSRRILKDDWAQEGVPFLRVRDLIHYSQTGELKNEFFVSEAFYNKLKEADGKVQGGDILVSATSTIGKCLVVRDGERFYYKDADVLRFREKVPINKVFFVYGLSMPTVENQINDTIGKTTVGHFLISKAATLKQPLPPVLLQETFEKVVRQADKSKFAGFKSQFIEMFGALPSDRRLADVAKIYDGVHQTPHYTSAGIKFISVEDISDIYGSNKYISKEDYDKYKHVPEKGDLIMTRIGTIGQCAVVSKTEPLAYYVSVTLIKPNQEVIDSTYLKYFIESSYGQNELRMRSLLEAFPMKINLNEIGKISLKIPSKEAQLKFVEVVNRADKSKFELKQSIERIDKVMRALMQ